MNELWTVCNSSPFNFPFSLFSLWFRVSLSFEPFSFQFFVNGKWRQKIAIIEVSEDKRIVFTIDAEVSLIFKQLDAIWTKFRNLCFNLEHSTCMNFYHMYINLCQRCTRPCEMVMAPFHFYTCFPSLCMWTTFASFKIHIFVICFLNKRRLSCNLA